MLLNLWEWVDKMIMDLKEMGSEVADLTHSAWDRFR